MRKSVAPVFSLSAVLALALSGCVPGATEPAPPEVTIEEVAVPASLTSTTPSAEVAYGMVAQSETLPWIIGGAVAARGEAPVPTVWTSSDGSSWSAATVGEVDGAFSGVIAGSEERAALGGSVWKDGAYSSVLFTTDDGDDWTAVDLPAEFRDGFRISSLAVTGDVVYGIAGDGAGGAAGIRIDGDDVAEFALPEVAEDELLRESSIAADGATLVLVATTGEEGSPEPTVTYTSDDAGATWGEAVEVTDALGFVAGIVHTGDGFLATGGLPRDEGGTSAAAAWFSTDGASWTAESVPGASEEGPLFVSANADIWLSVPLARDGIAAAVYVNDNAAVSAVYVRQPGGAWSMAAQTSINSTNGATGIAMPASDGSVVGAMLGGRYARVGLASGGAWTDTHTLAAREDVYGVSEIYPAEDEASLVLSRSTFTVESDLGWRNQSSTALGVLEGAVVKEQPWDPARAADLSGVRQATADDGSQITVGAYFAPGSSTILAEGFYRAAPDAEWTPVSGFDPAGATNLTGAEAVEGGWVAYGTYRASSNLSEPSHGAVWTSADGTTWTRGAGDFGSGVLESSLNGVCTLPGGDLVGVGWIEESAGEFRVAAWTSDGTTWTRMDVGELDDRTGYGLSCAAGEEGVILAATIGGRDTLLSTTDGSTWDEVFRADRGVTIGEPVAVAGGFAASGGVVGESFSGPVVWLSKTGAEWAPVSIPSYRSGSTSNVAAWGDDLIVSMSGLIGSPVSIVRGIEDVIASEAP